jgi:hypothetical protein
LTESQTCPVEHEAVDVQVTGAVVWQTYWPVLQFEPLGQSVSLLQETASVGTQILYCELQLKALGQSAVDRQPIGPLDWQALVCVLHRLPVGQSVLVRHPEPTQAPLLHWLFDGQSESAVQVAAAATQILYSGLQVSPEKHSALDSHRWGVVVWHTPKKLLQFCALGQSAAEVQLTVSLGWQTCSEVLQLLSLGQSPLPLQIVGPGDTQLLVLWLQ